MGNIERHLLEMHKNAKEWHKKPTLRAVYRKFHETISSQISLEKPGQVVELGSGIADIRAAIPGCIRTDIFPNPWVDRTENAYQLSFDDGSISNLILFDVFHHLQYPGTALDEFYRVLNNGGRVILFEPCISLLGLLVYGVLHPEPLALKEPITWNAPANWDPSSANYYAAQGNATRIFEKTAKRLKNSGFNIVKRQKFSAISYVASGGYSKPQMYPDSWLPLLRKIDDICDRAPLIFATRLLIVLEKTPT
jgi:SAM-dependent methyltransferase